MAMTGVLNDVLSAEMNLAAMLLPGARLIAMVSGPTALRIFLPSVPSLWRSNAGMADSWPPPHAAIGVDSPLRDLFADG